MFLNVWEKIVLFKILKTKSPVVKQENHAEILNTLNNLRPYQYSLSAEKTGLEDMSWKGRVTNLKESSFAKPKPTVGTSTRVLLKYSSTRLFWSNRRSFEYLSGTKRFGQADLFAFDFLHRNLPGTDYCMPFSCFTSGAQTLMAYR